MKNSRSCLAHAWGPTEIRTKKPPPMEQEVEEEYSVAAPTEQANGTAINARTPKLHFLGLPLFKMMDEMKARLDLIEANQRVIRLELDILSRRVETLEWGLKADRKKKK